LNCQGPKWHLRNSSYKGIHVGGEGGKAVGEVAGRAAGDGGGHDRVVGGTFNMLAKAATTVMAPNKAQTVLAEALMHPL